MTSAPATTPHRKTSTKEKIAARLSGPGEGYGRHSSTGRLFVPVARQGDKHQVAIRTGGMVGRDIVLRHDSGGVGTVRDITFIHDQIATEAREHHQ